MKFKFDPRTGRMVGSKTQSLQRHEIERLGGIVPDNRHINPGTAYIPEKDVERVKSAARRGGVEVTRLNGYDKDIGGALYRFEKTTTFESRKNMKKLNESTKVTLTFGQLKKLVKESMDESTNNEPDFNSIGDYELKLYAKLGWNYFNGKRSVCDEIMAKINAKNDEKEWEKRANDFVAAVNSELGQRFLELAWISHPDSFGAAEMKHWNALHLYLKDEGDIEETKNAIAKLAIPYRFEIVDTHIGRDVNDVIVDIEFKRK